MWENHFAPRLDIVLFPRLLYRIPGLIPPPSELHLAHMMPTSADFRIFTLFVGNFCEPTHKTDTPNL